MDTANLIGAPYIRLLGDSRPAPSEDVSLKMVLSNLMEIADYAKDKGVMPLIETNGFFAKTKSLGTLFRKELSGENVGILYDIHHPYRFFNENPAYTVDNIAPFVRHVHLKDSVMDGKKVYYKMIGEGDIPVAETVRILNKAGYRGFYSLEWSSAGIYPLRSRVSRLRISRNSWILSNNGALKQRGAQIFFHPVGEYADDHALLERIGYFKCRQHRRPDDIPQNIPSSFTMRRTMSNASSESIMMDMSMRDGSYISGTIASVMFLSPCM